MKQWLLGFRLWLQGLAMSFLCFVSPRDGISFGIKQVAGVADFLKYPHRYANGLIDSGCSTDGAQPVMSWDKSKVEGNGCDEATKHNVSGRLVTEVAEVVAQKEAGASALPSDHTPQKKKLASVYHTTAVTMSHDGVGG